MQIDALAVDWPSGSVYSVMAILFGAMAMVSLVGFFIYCGCCKGQRNKRDYQASLAWQMDQVDAKVPPPISQGDDEEWTMGLRQADGVEDAHQPEPEKAKQISPTSFLTSVTIPPPSGNFSKASGLGKRMGSKMRTNDKRRNQPKANKRCKPGAARIVPAVVSHSSMSPVVSGSKVMWKDKAEMSRTAKALTSPGNRGQLKPSPRPPAKRTSTTARRHYYDMDSTHNYALHQRVPECRWNYQTMYALQSFAPSKRNGREGNAVVTAKGYEATSKLPTGEKDKASVSCRVECVSPQPASKTVPIAD